MSPEHVLQSMLTRTQHDSQAACNPLCPSEQSESLRLIAARLQEWGKGRKYPTENIKGILFLKHSQRTSSSKDFAQFRQLGALRRTYPPTDDTFQNLLAFERTLPGIMCSDGK